MIRQPPTRARTEPQPGPVLEERVASLSAQLDVLRAQVRQAQQLASLGTAAAMLAHEANNLLTPIRGYVDYAIESNDPELMKKALLITSKNVQILMGMSSRILELGAAKPARRETVRVRSVVEDALAGLCRDLSKDGIQVQMEIAEELTAEADALQLQQVLFNLFLNAREAMAESHGGRLRISGRTGSGKTVFQVSNTGGRIPPEVAAHLFEPFQSSKLERGDGRRRCGGLGLALCRDLIEENGGTIRATSDDVSTTFVLELPAGGEERV